MSNQPDMPTPDTPQLLLEHHLKALRLPTILREYDKVARQCAEEKADFPRYLLRLTELELLDRDRRATERRIRASYPPGQVPRGQDPRHLRLPGHPIGQQDAGVGSGSVRVPLPQGERVAARQQ
jgi:hypothetical protein